MTYPNNLLCYVMLCYLYKRKERRDIKAKYTKNEIYDEIKRIYSIDNIINENIFNQNTTLDITWTYITHKYGGIKSICRELNIEYRNYNQLTRLELLKLGIELYNKYGYINKDLCVNNGINSSPIRNQFGNFTNYIKLIDYNYEYHRNVDKQSVLDDIQTFYNTHKSTSSNLYRQFGNYSCSIINRLGGWQYLLNSIGIEPKYKTYGLDYMINKVREIYEEYGYISKSLINDNCEFTYESFRAYFNNKKEMSQAIDKDNKNILFINNGFKSKKELEIANCLNNILGENSYMNEFTWNWLVNDKTNRLLYCDFYIPCLNLVIEYNGEQHYKFEKYIHKEYSNFKEQQYRDNLKYKLLKEHNINIEILTENNIINTQTIGDIINKY